MKAYLGMLLTACVLMTAVISVSLWITDSWAENYPIVVIAGAMAVICAAIYMLLVYHGGLNRDLENADTANTLFRGPGLDS